MSGYRLVGCFPLSLSLKIHHIMQKFSLTMINELNGAIKYNLLLSLIGSQCWTRLTSKPCVDLRSYFTGWQMLLITKSGFIQRRQRARGWFRTSPLRRAGKGSRQQSPHRWPSTRKINLLFACRLLPASLAIHVKLFRGNFSGIQFEIRNKKSQQGSLSEERR